MEITNVQVKRLFAHQRVKAVVSVTINGDIAVNDIRVIQGDDRLFVAMPSKYNVNEQGFHDVVHPITSQARVTLEDAVLRAYGDSLRRLADHAIQQ